MSTRSREIQIPTGLTITDLIDALAKKQIPYPPRLTKYEIARIVAARAKQLASGAKPLVDPKEVGSNDPVIIALAELREGKLPIVIVRTLPNGRRIEVKLKDLQKLEHELNFALPY